MSEASGKPVVRARGARIVEPKPLPAVLVNPPPLGELLDDFAAVGADLMDRLEASSALCDQPDARPADIREARAALCAAAERYLATRCAVLNKLWGGTRESLNDFQKHTLSQLRRRHRDWDHRTAVANMVKEIMEGEHSDREDWDWEAKQMIVKENFDIDEAGSRLLVSGLRMIDKAEESVLPQILREAARTYCIGLDGATAVLCRTALEVYLKDKLKFVLRLVRAASDTENLRDLIRVAAQFDLLRPNRPAADGSHKSTESDLEIADRIREAGKAWAHGDRALGDEQFSADVAQLFWDTVELLERIAPRKPHRRR
jgi:hypothetical protein